VDETAMKAVTDREKIREKLWYGNGEIGVWGRKKRI